MLTWTFLSSLPAVDHVNHVTDWQRGRVTTRCRLTAEEKHLVSADCMVFLDDSAAAAAAAAHQWHDEAHLHVVSHTDYRFPADYLQTVDRPLFVDGPWWPTRTSARSSSSSSSKPPPHLHTYTSASRRPLSTLIYVRRICITLFGPTGTSSILYPYSTVVSLCVYRAAELNWQSQTVWQWTAVGKQQLFISWTSASRTRKQQVGEVVHLLSLRPCALQSKEIWFSCDAMCCSLSTFHSCHVNHSGHA